MFQRGLFLLHASALQFEDRVFIFPGQSLSGKSTILAYLIQKGAKLITEDTAVIKLANGEAKIMPSYPMIKISNEANRAINFSNNSGTPFLCDKNNRLDSL